MVMIGCVALSLWVVCVLSWVSGSSCVLWMWFRLLENFVGLCMFSSWILWVWLLVSVLFSVVGWIF